MKILKKSYEGARERDGGINMIKSFMTDFKIERYFGYDDVGKAEFIERI